MLSDAVEVDEEYIGTFSITRDGATLHVDAWSNTIQDDQGEPIFRLVALARTGQRLRDDDEAVRQSLADKDTLLFELQHRVKNNLQMITALIRMEARNVSDQETGRGSIDLPVASTRWRCFIARFRPRGRGYDRPWHISEPDRLFCHAGTCARRHQA